MKDTCVYWLTGLSGSGKTTIANCFKQRMTCQGKSVRILDGDDIREKKHKHLDFTMDSIKENNRLIAELCRAELGKYDYILVSVISPFAASREKSRVIVGQAYQEIYIKTCLETVIKRDPKGLYKKALAGEIDNFIGVSSNVPYEVPQEPDIVLETETLTVDQCVDLLVNQNQENYVS